MSEALSDSFGGANAKAARTELRTKFLRRFLMVGGVVAVLVISAGFYLWGGRYVGTDDAYVRANKLAVSTDVSGLVEQVNVKEGQKVQAGDVLFALDTEPFQIALDNAKAALASAAQEVESARAQYRASVGQIAAQQAQVNVNRATLARYEALATQNAIAPIQVDTSRAALLSAQATLVSLQQTAAMHLASLGGRADISVEQTPVYRKAQAAVNEARRQLEHAVVRAPFAGTVAEVDSLQPGMLVISAMSAFSTTSAVGLIGDETWIDANLKETDLTHLNKGAPADITVDAYPGCQWHGHVETIGAASESSFSALPSENSGGNWVKVVQRIPVRISVDRGDCKFTLRAGMSAIVSLDTGKRHWQRLLRR